MALVLTNIGRGGTTNVNGEGNMAYVHICLAATYGRSAAVETATDNVISAISAGPEFYKYEGARSSVKFKTTSTGETDAKSFNTEGEIFIPGITAAKTKQLGLLCNHPVVLIGEDRTGNIRKAGQEDDGVEIDFEEMTEGKNGYLLKFKIEGQPNPPSFIDALATIPLPA